MPHAVSKKQFRMMQAIMHGKAGTTARGDKGPPKSVAAQYIHEGGKGKKREEDENLPESKGQEHNGGKWDEGHKKKDKERTKGKRIVQKLKEKRKKDKKSKKELKKAFEEFYAGRGAGVIVLDSKGNILVGKGSDDKWQTPGGHCEPGEDFREAALRELKEEAGIVANDLIELNHFKSNGNDSKTFLAKSFNGTPKDTQELKDVQFVDPMVLLDWDLRDCCKIGLESYLMSAFKKSTKLNHMMMIEKLEKNIMRGGVRSDVVFDVSHGDALRLVGNGCFRWLKQAVEGMGDEDFRELHLDNHVISIRKHVSDVYSGRIRDGHKIIHQFTNKSLPQLCADVMSIFEWYSDKDEHVFDILDEHSLPDDVIHGGLEHLADNYKKHNLANIYTEMENIRQEIRHGNAVDLQQVEEKIMKLFDKLEDTTQTVISQHNKLAEDAGKEIENLEAKLKELACKVDELSSKPEKIEAYQTSKISPDRLYDAQYMYLPKPEIHVEPNGKIKIVFGKDWTDMEKSNFLKDMRANIIRRE